MANRRTIISDGISFSASLSRTITTRDELTDSQFDFIMERGLMQAKSEDSRLAKDVFADLKKR